MWGQNHKFGSKDKNHNLYTAASILRPYSDKWFWSWRLHHPLITRFSILEQLQVLCKFSSRSSNMVVSLTMLIYENKNDLSTEAGCGGKNVLGTYCRCAWKIFIILSWTSVLLSGANLWFLSGELMRM